MLNKINYWFKIYHILIFITATQWRDIPTYDTHYASEQFPRFLTCHFRSNDSVSITSLKNIAMCFFYNINE